MTATTHRPVAWAAILTCAVTCSAWAADEAPKKATRAYRESVAVDPTPPPSAQELEDPRSSSLINARRRAAGKNAPASKTTDGKRTTTPVPVPPSPAPAAALPPPPPPPIEIEPALNPRARPPAPTPTPPPSSSLSSTSFSQRWFTKPGDIYAAIGLPGLMVGYAQPFLDSFNLRVDFSTIPGTYSQTQTDSGVPYEGDWSANRLGLFLDFFPWDLGFRLVGGLTFSDYHIRYRAESENAYDIMIGGTQYRIEGGGGVEVEVRYPKVMPYLGLGWGHNPLTDGFSAGFDVGLMFGRPTVTARPTGTFVNAYTEAIAQNLSAQADYWYRTYVDYPFIPQLSVALTYRF